jgi:phage gp29-like protein
MAKKKKQKISRHLASSMKDQDGKVVSVAELTEDVAGAQVGGVRQWISGHPADGMTPIKLASILRAADQGEVEAYFELAEDIEERDSHYLAQLATRRRSVSQLPITVTPASDSAEHKKHAEFLREWIKTGVLRSSLFDMLDAIGKAISVMEVDWHHKNGKVLPRALVWRTQRWFTFDRTDGETLLLREGVAGEPLIPHKFVVHRSKAKSGLTIRSGIARVAVWLWMFKSFTVKDWAVFIQNYGQPIRIGKYGRGATEQEKDVLWRAVSGIAGDCAAIIPREMLIEFHEVGSKSSSTDMFEKRADWYNREVSKLILGQTTTTDAVSGGHAVAKEHRLVQEDIERSDALDASDTLNAQLVPNIIAFNFGPQDEYPTIHVGRPDEVPLKDFSEAFDKLAKHGLTAEATFLRDRLGIPAPKEGAELVGGRVEATVPPEDKPQPKQLTAKQSLDRLFASAHSREEPDLLDKLTDRLEKDAAAAMDGMIDEVREILSSATDLRDAARKLADLDLSADALAEAMARGMTMAHLIGQAALIDDLKRQS